jgi:hypothetical protein
MVEAKTICLSVETLYRLPYPSGAIRRIDEVYIVGKKLMKDVTP